MHKVMKEIDVLITEIKNHLFVLVSNSLLEVEQYKRKITKYIDDIQLVRVLSHTLFL
jgi:hypothetical protein